MCMYVCACVCEQFEVYQQLVEHVVDMEQLPNFEVNPQHDPQLEVSLFHPGEVFRYWGRKDFDRLLAGVGSVGGWVDDMYHWGVLN